MVHHTHRRHHHRLATAPEPLTDDALLGRFHRGDAAAFVELYQRHHRDAHHFALRLTVRRPDDAEEVVSEAIGRMLAAIHRGRGPRTGFRPYLFTTIRSVVVSRHEREQLQPISLDALDAADIPILPSAEQQLDEHAIRSAYRSLPERWRRVLWETEVNSRPPRDAAELFGITPNTLSALARRARAGLRSAYADEDDRPATA